VRSSVPARTAAALAVAALLTAGIAGAADAAKGGNGGGGKGGGGKPSKGSTTTSTSLTGSAAAKAAYDDVCPKVASYTSCGSLDATIADFGATGWVGRSHPAAGSLDMNTFYTYSQSGFSTVVAHEVGGHIDTWNELVAKVGTTQAWTDYYDIDTFAQPWITQRWAATMGTNKSFSTSQAKEGWLDCRGPVAHGYRGDYLYSWGIAAGSAQQSFCRGYGTVLTEAMTN
jgi:hypothetical protein